MAYTAQELIKIAEAEVGYLEKKSNSNLDNKTGNAGYNNYTKYARDLNNAGYYNGNKNGYAWCDVFVDWCHWIVAGKDAKEAQRMICQTGLYGAGCTYSMQYYKNAGRLYKTPKVGDQIFFGSGSSSSHTGIVYKVDHSKVYTIEGNTSSQAGVVANGGGVFKKSYSRNYYKIVGYGRPCYDGIDEEITTLVKGDSGAEVKQLQENLIKLGYSCGAVGADGDFGSGTLKAVKAFQKDNKLTVDGVVGEITLAAIKAQLAKLSALEVEKEEEQKETYTLQQFVKDVQAAIGATVDGEAGPETLKKTVTLSKNKNNKHKVVVAVQRRLYAMGYTEVGPADGEIGPKFISAVKAFQKKHGCTADGVITARNKTWKKLLGM